MKRALYTALSAALIVLAFPPFDLGFLGFIALVPFAFAVRGETARRAALLGGAYGLVVSVALFGWALRMPSFDLRLALVLGVYLALYPAVLAALWARFGGTRAAIIVLPIAIVALDWARSHAGVLAFSLGSLGQTQHANHSLLQLASVGGEPLVTWVVALANVAIVERGKKALGVVVLAHVVGAVIAPSEIGRTMTVSAVQPNFVPGAKTTSSAVLDRLTREAAGHRAELVVWPESAGGRVEEDFMARMRARAIVDGANVPVLVGSSGRHNSLLLMKPDTPVAPEDVYRKVRLVPFIEKEIAGDARRTIDLDGVAIEPVICFESLFADDVRETASESPSVITVAANDGWFGESGGPWQHNIASVFRAVENRRPVVIASMRGPSQIIDASGRVVAQAAPFTESTVTASVRIDAPAGLYRRYGDRTWAMAALFLLAWALAGVFAPIALKPRRASLTMTET